MPHSRTLPAGPPASGLNGVLSVYCKLHLHEHSGDSICERGVVDGCSRRNRRVFGSRYFAEEAVTVGADGVHDMASSASAFHRGCR
ncbi:hypothetical protein MTO96_005098 [Rhipicephalus appendiculatus]